jgi:hypothetical protein
MNIIKKILKWGLISVLGLGLIGAVAGWAYSQPMPEGVSGTAADALAQKMMNSVNKAAWDTTRYLRWSFPGGHDYIWDKDKGLVDVRWGANRVVIDDRGNLIEAWKKDQAVDDAKAKALAKKAWSFFCNDSFWLNAVVKAFDPGTTRSIVKQEDGSDALLVQYSSGGVTPGDAYLWVLDENGRPLYYRMWVSIIPVGGLKATWEDWITLSTGAVISSTHDLGILSTKIKGIKGGNTLAEIGLEKSPF